MLESSSERLSAYYRLPDIVQGAVVVAVGSSIPELSTTVISAAIHGAFEIGVAAIVGSALFNILVIPALAGLVGGEQLRANRDLVYKESQFYMVAGGGADAHLFVRRHLLPDRWIGGHVTGRNDARAGSYSAVLYLLYVFVQYQDTIDHEGEADARDIRPVREWLRLTISLFIIIAGVEGLVRSAISFGEIFETPGFLWGITVIAAGTSVPDAFVSVRAARAGRGITSMANVLGSNIFDLLVCIPAGVLVAGASVINFSVAAPMMAVLTAATVALFLMMRTGMVLSQMEAASLLALYLGFLVWITAESFALVDLAPRLPPSDSVAIPH